MLLQTIQVVQMFAAYNMLVVVFSIGTLLKAMPVFQNFVIRAFDAVTRTKLPVGSYWDTLFTRKMFENVWHSVVLDLKKKVHHGCRAINPPVVSQDGRQCFPLLHMAKTGRPLVLNFGSCTCPIFMSKLTEFQQMVQEYCHIADFCVVYIEEAHPLDGWALNNNFAIRSHRSQTERCLAASLLAQKLSACPVVVDTMLDAANIGYGALPIRLHVVKENTLVYEGGAGPMGYNMDEVRDWLKRYSSITS